MLRAVQTEHSVAKAREEALLRQLNELKKEATALNETEIQYQTMAKEQETTQKMFDMVLQRLKETGVTSGLEANNVRLIEEAQVPKTPARPNKRATVLLAASIGVFLGGCLAFVLEYMDNTIKTPDDIRRWLDRPVLTVVPKFGSSRWGRLRVWVPHEGPARLRDAARSDQAGAGAPHVRRLTLTAEERDALERQRRLTASSNL